MVNGGPDPDAYLWEGLSLPMNAQAEMPRPPVPEPPPTPPAPPPPPAPPQPTPPTA
jgi:hypothetical protein